MLAYKSRQYEIQIMRQTDRKLSTNFSGMLYYKVSAILKMDTQ